MNLNPNQVLLQEIEPFTFSFGYCKIFDKSIHIHYNVFVAKKGLLNNPEVLRPHCYATTENSVSCKTRV